jgi:hypothetical protein
MMIIIVDTQDKIRAFIVDPVEVIRYAGRAYADERIPHWALDRYWALDRCGIPGCTGYR